MTDQVFHRGRLIQQADDDADLFGDLAEPLSDDDIEVTGGITARTLRVAAKSKVLAMMKGEHLRDTMKTKPRRGYHYHLISNGKYDFWTWIPHLIGLLGRRVDNLYASTWTINRANVVELLKMIDENHIRSAAVLSGLYFKRRESSVYAQLLTGLQDRGQRFVCFENHAKVALLANVKTGDFVTVEGSANFTANPRVEQYCLCNSRAVYDFHRAWMEEALDNGRKEKSQVPAPTGHERRARAAPRAAR